MIQLGFDVRVVQSRGATYAAVDQRLLGKEIKEVEKGNGWTDRGARPP